MKSFEHIPEDDAERTIEMERKALATVFGKDNEVDIIRFILDKRNAERLRERTEELLMDSSLTEEDRIRTLEKEIRNDTHLRAA